MLLIETDQELKALYAKAVGPFGWMGRMGPRSIHVFKVVAVPSSIPGAWDLLNDEEWVAMADIVQVFV